MRTTQGRLLAGIVRAIWGVLLLALCSTAPGAELVIRPHPQIVQRSAGDFLVTARSRIVIPENWPDYVKASARELATALGASLGASPQVVEVGKPDVKKGDIVVAPYEWLARYLVFMEPTPQALVRPAPAEGYTVRIVPSQVLLAGNSERGCFMGLQTLIQIARQGEKKEGGLNLRGVLISDWPTHGWRTLQHPFGVYGSAYDRGEHRYRHITRVAVLERSVRLAAHHKLTGLCVEVGTGMAYDRSPEIFVEGFATNKRQDVKAVVDLAKSLGLALVPFQNVSAAHDIWTGPYAYAVPNSELYMEALYGIFDETLEVFRPAHFHIGLDEDVAKDFDERPLRDVEVHRKVMLDCYDFLRRRGVSVLVWNDGVELLREGQAALPRSRATSSCCPGITAAWTSRWRSATSAWGFGFSARRGRSGTSRTINSTRSAPRRSEATGCWAWPERSGTRSRPMESTTTADAWSRRPWRSGRRCWRAITQTTRNTSLRPIRACRATLSFEGGPCPFRKRNSRVWSNGLPARGKTTLPARQPASGSCRRGPPQSPRS